MHTGQGVAETGSAFSGAWKGSETMAKGKYEYWKSDDGLLLIEGWARDGLTNEQIAHNIGISRETLNVWTKKYSDISDALKKSKDVVDRQVENALFKKACEGDTTAMIFWLKNRRPNDWRDKRETQLSGNVQTGPDRLVFVCAEDDDDE
jgi:hypothetical protein